MEQNLSQPNSQVPRREFSFDDFRIDDQSPADEKFHPSALDEEKSPSELLAGLDGLVEDASYKQHFDFDTEPGTPLPQMFADPKKEKNDDVFSFLNDGSFKFGDEYVTSSQADTRQDEGTSTIDQSDSSEDWWSAAAEQPAPVIKNTWSLSNLLKSMITRKAQADTFTNRIEQSEDFEREANSKARWASEGDPIGILGALKNLFVSAKVAAYRTTIVSDDTAGGILTDSSWTLSQKIGVLSRRLNQLSALVHRMEGSAAGAVLNQNLADDIIEDLNSILDRIEGKSALPLAETLAGRNNPFAQLATLHDQEVLRCTQTELRAQEAMNRKLVTEMEKAHLCNLANFRAAKIATECNRILLSAAGVRKIAGLDSTLESLLELEQNKEKRNKAAVAALKALIQAGVKDMGNICALTDEELTSLPRVGQGTVQEIRRIAKRMGLPAPFAPIPDTLRASRAGSFVWPIYPGNDLKDHLENICGATVEDCMDGDRLSYHLVTKIPRYSFSATKKNLRALFG